MAAIASEDLLSLEMYAKIRPEYRRLIIDMKRHRRVLLSAHISLVFESRETILYQIQEMLWVERLTNAPRIAQEIAEYDRLVPRGSELTATVMVQGGSWDAGCLFIKHLVAQEDALFLRFGSRRINAVTISNSNDTDCPVQYVRFPLEAEAIEHLVHCREDLFVGAMYAGQLEIVPLSMATLDELALDLTTSCGRGAKGPCLHTKRNPSQKEGVAAYLSENAIGL